MFPSQSMLSNSQDSPEHWILPPTQTWKSETGAVKVTLTCQEDTLWGNLRCMVPVCPAKKKTEEVMNYQKFNFSEDSGSFCFVDSLYLIAFLKIYTHEIWYKKSSISRIPASQTLSVEMISEQAFPYAWP